MNKQTLFLILTIAVVAVIAVFLNQKKEPEIIPPTPEPVVQDVVPQNITVKGTYTDCLPRHDNFSSPECFVGMKAEDNSFYILDFNLMSQTKPAFKNGDSFTAQGVFTPIEMLSSNHYQGSIAKGIFSITNIETKPAVAKPAQGKCYVGGCSAQVCSDRPDVVSTCEYRESYACYKTEKCERQADGQCGWTQTASLKACLAK